MADPGLNQLLKWGVENSEASRTDGTSENDPKAVRDPSRGFNQEMLAALLGGHTDADRMREAMTAILSPDVTVDDKVTAFDNFEQLIENLDNANNMESLGLWMPLVQQLDNEEAELRRMAAWCVGTAVQNNVKSQERLLIVGGIPKLTKMATNDTNAAVRKKAVFALSSEVRNYQPALNEAQKALPDEFRGREDIDAGDMEAVDGMMAKLRHSATKAI